MDLSGDGGGLTNTQERRSKRLTNVSQTMRILARKITFVLSAPTLLEQQQLRRRSECRCGFSVGIFAVGEGGVESEKLRDGDPDTGEGERGTEPG